MKRMTKQAKLTEKSHADLVDEAQRRHVYVRQWLHVSPSAATRDDLIRAIRADERRRQARKRSRERRRTMMIASAVAGGALAGGGVAASVLVAQRKKQPPLPPLPPYPSRFSTPMKSTKSNPPSEKITVATKKRNAPPSIPADPVYYSPPHRSSGNNASADDSLLHNRFTELLAQQAAKRAARQAKVQRQK